jgi:hypothetical protein
MFSAMKLASALLFSVHAPRHLLASMTLRVARRAAPSAASTSSPPPGGGLVMRIIPIQPFGALVLVLLFASSALAGEQKPRQYKRSGTVRATSGDVHTLIDIAEIEPNNHPSQAQDVGCGNSLNPATLSAGAVPDSDWISLTANAGDLITFETAATDTTLILHTDTIINLIASDGMTSLAVNDDTATSHYSRIADFEAPYTGIYYGRIRGFDAAEGPYRANLSCAPAPGPPSNDSCEGAIPIPYGAVNLSGTTRFATDDYNLCPAAPVCGGSCTGFFSPGKDVVYRLDIIQAGDGMNLTYTLSPASTDASIYVISDCGRVEATCVAGNDSDIGTPPEELSHAFPEPGTYYLILDAFSAAGGSFTLQGCVGCISTPVRPTSWGRLKTIYR